MSEQRRDICPTCGIERVELVVARGRFYCHSCGVAGDGPNHDTPAGVQLTLEEAAHG